MSNIPKGYNEDGEYTGADDPTFDLMDEDYESPIEDIDNKLYQ